jgi:site-specific DNA-methyltransferase (adenine-specific)
MFDWNEMKNKIILADNKDIMKDIPDKFFELAIVDPPYGIGDWTTDTSCYPQRDGSVKRVKRENVKKVEWNNKIPSEDYFNSLKRVSCNQIIWGANYYNCFDKLGGCLIWHKGNINPVFSQCEIASLSFQKRVDYIKIDWQAGFARKKEGETIHPCQKPVALYRWLLQNYAKPGDKIIDTHSGSGSLACACHLEKFDFLAIEKDEDYYKASVERLEILRSQGTLF